MSGDLGDIFNDVANVLTLGTYKPMVEGVEKAAGVITGTEQAEMYKSAQDNARAEAIKAEKNLQAAQATASAQAQAAISQRRRRITQTIYTDPLGIGTMAETARKTLTGQ